MTAPSSHQLPDPPDAPALTVRTPVDVLAVVPVVLGFVPHDSVAMLTVGSGPRFHARVDLPEDEQGLADVAAELVAPVIQHEVDRVQLIVYTTDAVLAARAATVLGAELVRAGAAVGPVLRADGRRWWWAGEAGPGEAYDLSSHPFSAQAVLDGRVVHGSRDELRATVAACPDRVAGVVAALAAPPEVPPGSSWISDLVRAGSPPDDAGVAVLLRALLDPDRRDAAWCGLSRHTAREHVAFWSDVVRRAPDALAPAPAAVLALAAWRSGDGALAWCALDRCLEVDPDHPLGGVVRRLLTEAVPPDVWEEVC